MEPTLHVPDADPSRLYTIILSDPDAPNTAEPKFAEWQHWVQVNVRVDKDSGAVVDKGESVTAFFGPAPGKDSGRHRYCLVVYEQEAAINVDPAEKLPLASGFPARRSFNSRSFASKHNLSPVAALSFFAQFDENVPELAKKVAPPPS